LTTHALMIIVGGPLMMFGRKGVCFRVHPPDRWNP
jgi:hypothetical protein